MASLTQFGNRLYTGESSFPFVAKRRTWFLVALAVIVLSVLGPLLRGGFEFGIEFRGGSEFRISGVEQVDEQVASDAVTGVLGANAVPNVARVGQDGLRVQTEQLSDADTVEIRDALASALDVSQDEITSSFVGPSWGQDITRQAIIGLIAFVLLAAIIMAFYFRTWKMSVAALASLFFTLIVTLGVYGTLGFEITPAAVIGFLTILSYSLYDVVVVFDKIRENTAPGTSGSFLDNINLAVNQTLVRSINTSVIAALPTASILFIGSFLLGAGTLRDISLALLIGTLVGAWATLFVAAPLYAQMRKGDEIGEARVKRASERGAVV
ncbi:protein translocase subunit SecF [Agrococcus sp. SGAir0287]|uniref:protein translocase subunit SecF n=1 Tax=Agrococcus sp. SGAir0287 TaxID=2070347 RepID=UPI0010CD1E36|nr:protein translocase subunit SecF [Agrococcus sp. SGAir0287]QCR19332.1 protein translocase subunit SecF [Agrococcus sp. SGAir0287]